MRRFIAYLPYLVAVLGILLFGGGDLFRWADYKVSKAYEDWALGSSDDDPPYLAYRACPPTVDPRFGQVVACHWAVLPEDWETGRGEVRLPILIVEPADKEAAPRTTPVVMVAGGPGEEVLGPNDDLHDWPELASEWPWVRDGPLVLYDQRGVGGALPLLDCPGYKILVLNDLMDETPKTVTEIGRRAAARLKDCAARLGGAGVNLAHYDTVASARDLIALRSLLTYREWALFGPSYGSRLSLEVLRQDDAGITAVVLAGLYASGSPGTEADLPALLGGLETASDLCRDSGAPCLDEPVATVFRQTLVRFRAKPPVDQIQVWASPYKYGLEVDEVLFIDSVREALDLNQGWEVALNLIRNRGNDWEAFAPDAVNNVILDLGGFSLSLGAHYMVHCNDNPDPNPDIVDDLVATQPHLQKWIEVRLTPPDCGPWRHRHPSRLSRAPVESDVPVLLLEGATDQRTPFVENPTGITGLGDLHRILLPDVGHAVWTHPLARSAVRTFLSQPMAPQWRDDVAEHLWAPSPRPEKGASD